METLTQKLNALSFEALGIIKNHLSKNNGIVIYASTETAYNKADECLTDDFLTNSFNTLLDTQYSENEDLYFLKLQLLEDGHTVNITMIDEQGEDHLFELGQSFTDAQIIEFADFVNTL
jgi:hypothetical protein